MRSGLEMMARAMETRRRMPPESSGGNFAMVFSSSTNLKGLDDALVGLFFGDLLFVEAVGHVVFDGEGVEERGFLKDHADARAQLEEIGLAHAGDVLAEDANGAGVGPNEAIGQLHQNGFSAAGRAEDDAGFAALDGEGDVLRGRA